MKKNIILTLIFVFILSFGIRFHKISDYLFFGYEQGRDAFVIKSLYTFQDFTLVGPKTDLGGIFHGPYYYYTMAIPYFLSQGNPLAASIFLIFFGSLVPVLIYFLAKEIFDSRFYGVIAAIILALSFEYILYSRWLSNVSLSVVFSVLAYYFLWRYVKKKAIFAFYLFVFCVGVAGLFELILLPQFLFSFLILFFCKIAKINGTKQLVTSFIILAILFSPLIIFDFRNQHISLNSLLFQLSNPEGGSFISNIFNNFKLYILQLSLHLKRAVLFTNNSIFILVFTLSTVTGFYLFSKKNKKEALFVLSWILMSLPLILIGPGNPHFYLGVGLAAILVVIASIKGWVTTYPKFKIIPFLIIFLLIFSWFQSFSDLYQNKNIFFVTIQNDLNLKDQKAILDFIHQDAKGQAYRLEAFTIPSLHPEGWKYLHNLYYPSDVDKSGNLIYVVIEKNVYPVWEQKWIDDFGKTNLEYEKQFGLLRLQKRNKLE